MCSEDFTLPFPIQSCAARSEKKLVFSVSLLRSEEGVREGKKEKWEKGK
jgi:hypothetical protein